MSGGVPTRFSWPTPSQSERKALLNKYALSQRKKLFAFASTRQILRFNNQANCLISNREGLGTSL